MEAELESLRGGRLKEQPCKLRQGKSSRSQQARQEEGQCGKLIRAHRERRRLTDEELAKRLEVERDEIVTIENGQSPLEDYAPLLLRFSEIIDQPIFNLFYPCGLPFEKLQDYP